MASCSNCKTKRASTATGCRRWSGAGDEADAKQPACSGPYTESSYASPRVAERDELQTLNARLASYIRHIRELKENASFIDSDIFLQSVKILEEELLTLKGMYEAELNQIRVKLDDVNRVKNYHALEEKKAKTLTTDLKNRLEVENQRNHHLTVEMHSLQRALAHRDNEIEQMRIDALQPAQQLDELQSKYSQAVLDQQENRKKFENEQLMRQEAEEKADNSQKKLQFQTTLFDQEKRELDDRLAAANTTIRTLEEKMRELNHHDQTMAAMLVQVRESAEAEVRRYQEESEARHSRHLTELKTQIDEDDKKITELNEETLRLNEQITQLIGQVRSFEAHVGSLEHLKACLENDLKSEKERGRDFAHRAQLKLRELQDVLVAKMRELNAARDAQIPLKAEIESYKALLEAEERRLMIGPSEYPDLPQLPTVQYNHMPSYSNNNYVRPVGPVKVPTSTGWGSRKVVPSSHGHYGQGEPMTRIRSAPAARSKPLNLIPTNLGQGRDYFDEMFRDLKLKENLRNEEFEMKKTALEKTAQNGEMASNASVAFQNTACAISDVTIMDIQPQGKYVKLFNSSTTKSEEIGNFQLQQNVSGHVVAVYRFPPQLHIPPGGIVTVWAADGGSEEELHKPPTDFVFREQPRWGSGPECTTILCRPNGQAMAWSTPFVSQSWFSRQKQQEESGDAPTETDPFQDGEVDTSHQESASVSVNIDEDQQDFKEENMEPELPLYDMNLNARRPEPVYLRRQKELPPSFAPPKHPYGLPPGNHAHTETGQQRPLTYGNDNSSVNRQSRSQSTRPDPIPGAPYTGAAAQRMGSASLRRYQGPSLNGQANRAIVY